MHAIRIARPRRQLQNNRAVISSEIQLPGKSFTLYFSSDPQYLQCWGGDAFLVACLLSAMKLKLPIYVDGEISPRLLCNIETIQDVFHCWNRNFAKVAVESQPRTENASAADGSAAFFSGGVDSFYTAFKQSEQLTHLVFVHGFDIALDNPELRKKIAGAMREAAATLGKPLIEIETNMRLLTDAYVSWPFHQFGAAMAAIALLLNPVAQQVFIPASESYAHLDPCGSHPLIDPLWSSEYAEIIHDGAEYSRNQKVAVIARHPEILKYLRVCWRNPDNSYNCGQCEKCIRTMINLETAGALGKCSAFDAVLDSGRIAAMRIPSDLVFFHVLENLEVLRAQGRNDAVVGALETAIARFRSEKIARELAAMPDLIVCKELTDAVNKHRAALESMRSGPVMPDMLKKLTARLDRLWLRR